MLARRLVVAVALLALVACWPRRSRPPRFGSLDASEREFRFEHGIELLEAKNGLKIALRRDPRTNLVGVDVRYQVGAAEDPPGRRGLAHLVEHLAFEARPGGADAPTIGARLAGVTLAYNAYTLVDETHYTSVALADQLDAVLAIEAQRMAITCDDLDEALFVRERDVVLAETAQRRGELDDTFAEIASRIWGADHPYTRQVGTEEVAAATRAEACEFLEAHYAPDRAILIVTGSFDVDRTIAAIGARFGPLTRRSTRPRTSVLTAELEGTRSEHLAPTDEASAFVFFRAPRWGDEDQVVHELVARLLRRRVALAGREQAWVTDVAVGDVGGWQARTLVVSVSVSDPARLDAAVELVFEAARAVVKEKTETIDILRAQLRTDYLALYDDFAGSGMWIADFLQYTTHNWFFLQDLVALDKLPGSAVRAHADAILHRDKSHVALLRPSGRSVARRSVAGRRERTYDLTPARIAVDPAEASRPLVTTVRRVARDLIDYRLDNGLRVLLAPDPDSVMVDARLVYPVGTAADPPGRAGLAAIAPQVLDHDYEQTLSRGDVTIINWALGLGTQLSAWTDERSTVLAARGIATFADWHVWRLFWLRDAGVFDGDEIAQVRRRVAAVDGDDEAVDRTRALALRTRLFGAGHPYAATPDTSYLRALAQDDLYEFLDRYYRPDGATLIVAGGFDVAVMQAAIAELYGSWRRATPPPIEPVPPIRPVEGPSYVGVVDEDAAQLSVTIAFATGSDPIADRAPRSVLARMLGDRAQVIREGLGASYGATVRYGGGAGGGILQVDAAVDVDRAAEALRRLLGELEAVRADATAFAEDFVRARRQALAGALADSAGATDLADELERLAVSGLPPDYDADLAETIARTTPEQVAVIATTDLAARRMVVVVSGPRAELDRVFAEAKLEAEIVE